jgi:hypothetical protein
MTAQLSFELNSTDTSAALCFEAWIDQQLMFVNHHVGPLQLVSCDLPSDDCAHVLRFVLKNKQAQHTTVDQQGNIVSDAVLQISNIKFDHIELGHNLLNLAEYQHDYNGHGSAVTQKFYNKMGCNGTVILKFTTPVYLWILENQ